MAYCAWGGTREKEMSPTDCTPSESRTQVSPCVVSCAMKARMLAMGATIAPRTSTVRSAPARRRRPLSSRSVRASSGWKAAASTAARNSGERKGQRTYAVSATATANSAQKVRRARVVGARGPSGRRARSIGDRLTLSAIGECYARRSGDTIRNSCQSSWHGELRIVSRILGLIVSRLRLEDRERRAGRILQYPESADVRDVLGPEADGPAELPRARDRRVRVVDGDVRQPVRPLTALVGPASAIDAVPGEDVVRASRAGQRAVREPEDLLVERERFRRVVGVQLVPAPATTGWQRVGRITLEAPERTELGALRVSDPRGPAHGRDVVGRLDDLAAVRGGGLHGRVDVLDGNVRDPVGRLEVALRVRVTADHRVAGVDHVIGGVSHRERLYLPPQHLAVERLRPLGVLGDELEPDELPRKLLAIGHLWLLSGA